MLVLIGFMHPGIADVPKPKGSSSYQRSMAALENRAVNFAQASLVFYDAGAMARLKSYPLYRLRVDAFRSRTTRVEK